jgi:hypothetical protein
LGKVVSFSVAKPGLIQRGGWYGSFASLHSWGTAGIRSSTYSPRLDDREAAGALFGDFRHPLDRETLARAGGQGVQRQDDDAGSGPTMANSHLGKSPVVGDDDTSGRLRQRENALVAVAPADPLASTTSRPRWISPSTIARATHSSAKKAGMRGSLGGDDPLVG